MGLNAFPTYLTLSKFVSRIEFSGDGTVTKMLHSPHMQNGHSFRVAVSRVVMGFSLGAYRGSNPEPLAPQASALPIEL